MEVLKGKGRVGNPPLRSERWSVPFLLIEALHGRVEKRGSERGLDFSKLFVVSRLAIFSKLVTEFFRDGRFFLDGGQVIEK